MRCEGVKTNNEKTLFIFNIMFMTLFFKCMRVIVYGFSTLNI